MTALRPLLLLALSLALLGRTWAAGTLQPTGANQQPIQIRDHHVNVVIDNGYARTEVTQTFANPNPTALEAIYAFPLPKSASLADVTLTLGEQTIHGEVVPKQQANQLYQQERDQGRSAGVANQESYQRFEFKVSPVPANGTATVRFVYYQPLSIDTGIVRYLYPLEEGGTDDQAALGFWARNSQVENDLTIDVEVKSVWPIADLRLPYYQSSATEENLAEGHRKIRVSMAQAKLEHDFVLYYRLADNLPGRVELVAYRPDEAQPGTFMLVVTPGLDLQPLHQGANYVFVLDRSGSMQGKLATLADGVSQALGKLKPGDQFRIVVFDSSAQDLCGGWQPVDDQSLRAAIAQVKALTPGSSTNLYDGLATALKGLDDDRATCIVLVTDGVANTGEVNPQRFRELLQKYDLRVFGFLMGNSANWPLMKIICDASGGFYSPVSNQDDIVGQLLLAQSKIKTECLHDARLTIKGVQTRDATDQVLGKVYRGQQLVIFGRYDQPGPATVTLAARLTGEDQTYTTTFDFPALATDSPELERLWALDRVQMLEEQRDLGLIAAAEAAAGIRDLGLKYQLVTAETSMLALSDDAFAQHGIARDNQARLAVEHQAQATRAAQPPVNRQVDREKPAFRFPTPSLGGGGGGAIDPLSGLLVLLTTIALITLGTRRPHPRGNQDPQG